MNVLRRSLTVSLALFLLLCALGNPQPANAADGDRLQPAQRGQPTDSDEDEEARAISDLADAFAAVVQIEAVGTFVDPDAGMVANAAGTGSGFIIDEAGIAVTNNHVVTGGALFRVFVAGEDEPRTARVLGVAECADLAVIDIQGNGFPYLDWYDGPIRVGLDIYAAGFPLGDPEFTLTRGIIAKASAGGDSSWASVDSVLQHDADIVPGNSGGPLLDSEGKVVGINYRLNDAGQYFAISRDEALPLIERLRAGESVDSIGINAEAVTIDEDLTGVWVASVDSGSVADNAGIEAGDILLTMEGLDLATDGTLQTYCEILRSHDSDDVLAIEVLRFDTQEVLEGQLNGRVLEQSFSFADSAPESDGTAEVNTPTYEEYVTVTDEQGIISFDVPQEWSAVSEMPWTNADDEVIGLQLWAVEDFDAFAEDWGVPGAIVSYSEQLSLDEYTPGDLLDAIDYSESCTYTERAEITEGFYTGEYDIWEACGDGDSMAMIMGLVPETNDYLLRIEVYTAREADFDAMDRVLDTFVITPPGSSAPTDELEADMVAATVDDIDTSGLIYDYALIESPALSALLPAEWDDIVESDWVEGSDIITATLAAARDIAAFDSDWSEAGVSVYSALDPSGDLDPLDILDNIDFSDSCLYDDRVEHEHTIYGITYRGAFDIWTECGSEGEGEGENNVFVVLSALADTGDHDVLIYFSVIDDADVEAFDVLTRSFYVVTTATAPLIEAASLSSEEALPFNPDDYVLISDEEGAVTLSVPILWDDIMNDDWFIDGEVVGRGLTVSTDAAAFEDRWDTPGVFAGVSSTLAASLTPDDALDLLDFSDECTFDDRYAYANEALEGVYEVWFDCGEVEGTVFVTLAANPDSDDSQIVLLYVNMVEEADVTAFEQILDTLTLGDQVRATARPTTATVLAPALNVRAGPGTNFGRVAAVAEGDELTVTGQSDNCAWLLIRTPDGQPGWVSGNSQYTQLNGDCGAIPEESALEAGSQAGGGQSNSGQSGAQASGGQGCYTFQNQLGAELNITFTRRDSSWNTTFQVAPKGENRQCFDPGSYTYTLDAPPPWGSSNGELTVGAGDNFAFPIYGE